MHESKGLRRGEGLFPCTAGRIATTAMAIALVALAVTGALAQDRAATGRIPTVTRLVRIMMDEEAQLGAAARGGNRQAIDALLGEDFEMRIGTAPGTPVPRAEWMASALAKPEGPQRIEQMSAHEMGDLVIASFLERPEATAQTADAATFVTDVWKKTGDRWKLVRRFVAPGWAPAFEPMGAGTRAPDIPKR